MHILQFLLVTFFAILSATSFAAQSTQQKDLFHAFFGSHNRNGNDAGPPLHQIAETADFVNMIHEADWGDHNSEAGRQAITNTMVDRMFEAQSYGVERATLHVSFLVYKFVGGRYEFRGEEFSRPALHAFFSTLKKKHLLWMVDALYPIDEPDVNKASAEDVRKVNTLIRSVMSEFPELNETKLAVIYGSSFTWPGVETYDWVGFDDYGQGERIFSNGQYEGLKQVLRPDQRILLVPGGAFGQDPEPFLRVAQTDPQVIGIVSFIWFDNWESNPAHRGIRSNGMAMAYCKMGQAIIFPGSSPNCSFLQDKAVTVDYAPFMRTYASIPALTSMAWETGFIYAIKVDDVVVYSGFGPPLQLFSH